MIIAILVLFVLPIFTIIYCVVAETIKERREAREAKEKGIVLDTAGKPKYTYSFRSVLSCILLFIPVLILEAFKRTKRYK